MVRHTLVETTATCRRRTSRPAASATAARRSSTILWG